jgi:hypothetical protein
VRGEQHAAASRVDACAQVALEAQRAGRVEAVEGFVEHDEHGIAEQRDQGADFLPRAVGHQRDCIVEPRREAERFGEREHFVIDARQSLCRGLHGEAFARGQQRGQAFGGAA